MSSLDDLRKQYPALADLSDGDIINRIAAKTGQDPNMVSHYYGVEPDGNFVRGMKIAGRNTLGALGGAAAVGADLAGMDGAKQAALEYARDQFDRAQGWSRRQDDVANFWENPSGSIAAGLGQAVGYAIPSLVTGGVGGAVGGAVARRAAIGLAGDAAKAAVTRGAVRGGIAASGLNNVAQEVGSIYPEMLDNGYDESGRALAYGTVAGALDTIPEVLGVGRLVKPAVRKPGIGGYTKNLLTGATMGAAGEAATEVAQTAIERQGAYKDIGDDEATHEYANAAFLGALGGGAFGAASRLRDSGDLLGTANPAPAQAPAPAPAIAIQQPTGIDAAGVQGAQAATQPPVIDPAAAIMATATEQPKQEKADKNAVDPAVIEALNAKYGAPVPKINPATGEEDGVEWHGEWYTDPAKLQAAQAKLAKAEGNKSAGVREAEQHLADVLRELKAVGEVGHVTQKDLDPFVKDIAGASSAANAVGRLVGHAKSSLNVLRKQLGAALASEAEGTDQTDPAPLKAKLDIYNKWIEKMGGTPVAPIMPPQKPAKQPKAQAPKAEKAPAAPKAEQPKPAKPVDKEVAAKSGDVTIADDAAKRAYEAELAAKQEGEMSLVKDAEPPATPAAPKVVVDTATGKRTFITGEAKKGKVEEGVSGEYATAAADKLAGDSDFIEVWDGNGKRKASKAEVVEKIKALTGRDKAILDMAIGRDEEGGFSASPMDSIQIAAKLKEMAETGVAKWKPIGDKRVRAILGSLGITKENVDKATAVAPDEAELADVLQTGGMTVKTRTSFGGRERKVGKDTTKSVGQAEEAEADIVVVKDDTTPVDESEDAVAADDDKTLDAKVEVKERTQPSKDQQYEALRQAVADLDPNDNSDTARALRNRFEEISQERNDTAEGRQKRRTAEAMRKVDAETQGQVVKALETANEVTPTDDDVAKERAAIAEKNAERNSALMAALKVVEDNGMIAELAKSFDDLATSNDQVGFSKLSRKDQAIWLRELRRGSSVDQRRLFEELQDDYRVEGQTEQATGRAYGVQGASGDSDQGTGSGEGRAEGSSGDSAANVRPPVSAPVVVTKKRRKAVALEATTANIGRKNPDAGKYTKLSRTDLTNGRDAALWLAANMKDASLRPIAKLIAQHVANTHITYASGQSTLPSWAANYANAYKAWGLTVLFDSGDTEVSLNGSFVEGHTEENLLHELVHAATLSRLYDPANAQELTALANKVRTVLIRELNSSHDQVAREVAGFYSHGKILGDVNEFVAYAFSSPTFRAVLRSFNTKGEQILNRYGAESAPAGKRRKAQPVPEYTMWQRFVDAVMKMIGLPRVYKNKVDAIIAQNQAVEDFNREHYTPIQEKLDSLLQELLAKKDPLAPSGQVVVSPNTSNVGQSGGVGAGGQHNLSGQNDPLRQQGMGTGVGQRQPAAVRQQGVPGKQQATTTAQQFARSEQVIRQRVPKRLQPHARKIWRAIHDVSSRAAMAFAPMNDLADWAAKHGMKSFRYIVDIAAERGAVKHKRDLVLGEMADRYSSLSDAAKDAMNAIGKKMTFEQKWGFEPDWIDDPKQKAAAKKLVDAAMVAEWDAFAKQHPEAATLLKEMFKHGHTTWWDRLNSANALMEHHKAEAIAMAKALGKDAKEIEEIEKTYAKDRQSLGKLHGPYLPLNGIGDYVVVTKSKAFTEAVGDEARKMETDPNHYTVEFFESAGDAANRAVELADQLGADYVVNDLPVERHLEQAASYNVLLKMAQEVKANLHSDRMSKEDAAVYYATSKALHTAIIQMLGEHNARSNQIPRRFIAGERDVIRNFFSQGYKDNQFISAAHKVGEMEALVSTLRAERGPSHNSTTAKVQFYNEFRARQAKQFDAPPRFVGQMMRFTSVWKLITSPAYYLQYISQPITMFMPLVQGKHSYAKVWAEMKRAVGDSKDMAVGVLGMDISKHGDAKERSMLQELQKLGVIQIGHEQSLGHIETLPEGSISKAWMKATNKLVQLPQSVEMHNRVFSALAAYRLEIAAGRSHAEAVEYAKDVVRQAYGDYSAFNAPRVMQGNALARLAMQYRQFSIIHGSLLSRLVNNAFAGETKEVKAIARAQLGFMAGHYGVLAGALGIPGAHVLAMVIKGVFGDDRDKDYETFVRRHSPTPLVADMLLGGVPRAVFGQDLSSRLGAGDIFSPLRYVDMGDALTSRAGYNEMVTAFMGPAIGGLVPQMLDGVNTVFSGDYYRGLEKLLPKGMADAMIGARIAMDGAVDKKGMQVSSPDEIGMANAFARALGSNPTKISGPTHDAHVVREIQADLSEKAAKLKSEYVNIRNGTRRGDVADVIEKWRELMAKEREYGVKPHTLSDLYKAPAEIAKMQRNKIGGVSYTNRNRALVDDIAGE